VVALILWLAIRAPGQVQGRVHGLIQDAGGQAVNDETYAVCKSDLLIKGDDRDSDNIKPSSCLSADGHARATFDYAWRVTRRVDHPLTRFSMDLGPEAMTGASTTVAISPDGRRLAFPAHGADGRQQLSTRLLSEAEPTLLPGTESGFDPFFSPDEQWIGFFGGGYLRKISVHGGAPVSLTSIVSTQSGAQGASWGDDGNIVAAMGLMLPLVRVPAEGGATQPLTKLSPGEIAHRWPQVLPGSSAVLFTASVSVSGMDNANIEAVSLKTGQIKILQRGGYFGRYLPGGHLLYVHQGILFGVDFDPERLSLASMHLVETVVTLQFRHMAGGNELRAELERLQIGELR
jgi:serine/threonine-protein kinase